MKREQLHTQENRLQDNKMFNLVMCYLHGYTSIMGFTLHRNVDNESVSNDVWESLQYVGVV